MRYYHNGGMVLIWVLLMLQMMLLFTANAADALIIAQKARLECAQANHQFDQALQAMAALEGRVRNEVNHCLFPQADAAMLKSADRAWWSLHACRLPSRYLSYYFIESLGSDENIGFATPEYNQCDIAVFYRITLYFAGDDSGLSQPYIVQSTLAMAGDKRISCHEKLRLIKRGRQSVRQLL